MMPGESKEAKEARSVALMRRTVTLNPTSIYQPSTSSTNWAGGLAAIDNKPFFTWYDIPRMIRDPRVRFLEAMWRSPFQQVQWAVKATSPVVQKYVDEQMRKFWRESLPSLLTRYFWYGFAPGGAEFSQRRGLVRLDGVRVIEPQDGRPLVYTDGPHKGKMAGLTFGSVKVYLPHAYWFAGEKRFGQCYDMAPVSGMFEPWAEKRERNGAVDMRRTWFRKNASRGMVVRHPNGRTEASDEFPSGRDNQSIAREILDYGETNSSYTLPSDVNPGTDKPLWDIQFPESFPDRAGFLEYPQDLDAEMAEGVGIPREVLEASKVGSGYSGRQIPLQAWLGKADEMVGLVIRSCEWLKWAVMINFGSSAYFEVEPQSLVEKLLNDSKGPGGMGGAVQAMTQPPKDGGGGSAPAPLGNHSGGWKPVDGPRGGHWEENASGQRASGQRRHARYLSTTGISDLMDGRIGLSRKVLRRLRMHEKVRELSDARTLDPKARRKELLVLLAMLDFQKRAHAVNDPESAQPYLDALKQYLKNPDSLRYPLELSWRADETALGHIKAVGEAEHAGRVLYGARAEAALRAQEGLRAGLKPGERAVKTPVPHPKRDQWQKAGQRAQQILANVAGKSHTPAELDELGTHLQYLPMDRLMTARSILRAQFRGVRGRLDQVEKLKDHIREQIGVMNLKATEEPKVAHAAGELPTANPLDHLADIHGDPEKLNELANSQSYLGVHDAINAAYRGEMGPDVKAAVEKGGHWNNHGGAIGKRLSSIGKALAEVREKAKDEPAAPVDDKHSKRAKGYRDEAANLHRQADAAEKSGNKELANARRGQAKTMEELASAHERGIDPMDVVRQRQQDTAQEPPKKPEDSAGVPGYGEGGLFKRGDYDTDTRPDAVQGLHTILGNAKQFAPGIGAPTSKHAEKLEKYQSEAKRYDAKAKELEDRQKSGSSVFTKRDKGRLTDYKRWADDARGNAAKLAGGSAEVDDYLDQLAAVDKHAFDEDANESLFGKLSANYRGNAEELADIDVETHEEAVQHVAEVMDQVKRDFGRLDNERKDIIHDLTLKGKTDLAEFYSRHAKEAGRIAVAELEKKSQEVLESHKKRDAENKAAQDELERKNGEEADAKIAEHNAKLDEAERGPSVASLGVHDDPMSLKANVKNGRAVTDPDQSATTVEAKPPEQATENSKHPALAHLDHEKAKREAKHVDAGEDALLEKQRLAENAFHEANDALRRVGSKQPERRNAIKAVNAAAKAKEDAANEVSKYNRHRPNHNARLNGVAADETQPLFVRIAAARQAMGGHHGNAMEEILPHVKQHLEAHGHDQRIAEMVASDAMNFPLRSARKLDEVIRGEETRQKMHDERKEAREHIKGLGLLPHDEANAEREAGNLYQGDIGRFKEKWSGVAVASREEKARIEANNRKAAEQHAKDLKAQKGADDYLAAIHSGSTPPDADSHTMGQVVENTLNSPRKWHAGSTLPKGDTPKGIVDAIAKDNSTRFVMAKTIAEQGWATDSKYLVKATPEMVDYSKAQGHDKLEGRTPPVNDFIQQAIKRDLSPGKIVADRKSPNGEPQVLLEAENGKQATLVGQYVANIKKLYPNAVPFVADSHGPVVFKQGGEVVGLVMPLSTGASKEEEKPETYEQKPRLGLSDVAAPGAYSPDDVEETGMGLRAGRDGSAIHLRLNSSKSDGYTLKDGDREYGPFESRSEAIAAGKQIIAHAHGHDDSGSLLFKPKGASAPELPEGERNRLDYYAGLRKRAKDVKGKPKSMTFGDKTLEVHPVSEHFGVTKGQDDPATKKKGTGWDVLHLPTGLPVGGWTTKDSAIQHALATQDIPNANWGDVGHEPKDDADKEHRNQLFARAKGLREAFENNDLHPDMQVPKQETPKSLKNAESLAPVPFPPGDRDLVAGLKDQHPPESREDLPVQDVPVDSLRGTQDHIDPEKVAGMQEKGNDLPPMDVVKDAEGLHHVEDGHHRGAAAHANGDETVPARVWEKGEDGFKPAGAEAKPAVEPAPMFKHKPLSAEVTTIDKDGKKQKGVTWPFRSQTAKDIAEGNISADELRRRFEEFAADPAAVKAHLADVLKKSGLRSPEKIKEQAQFMFDRAAATFSPAESYTYSMEDFRTPGAMDKKKIEATRNALSRLTDEDLKSRAAGFAEKKAKFDKAMNNPETKDEFEHFIERKGEAALSPEQRAKWDDLQASTRRAREQASREAKAVVPGFAPGEAATGDIGIVEGHHQKRNAPTFTVTVQNRLGEDKFSDALQRAKRMGGSYVNAMIAKRYGATPGFQFFNKADAESFAANLRGESVDRTEQVKHEQADAAANRAESLVNRGTGLEDAAQQDLGRDRLTNTARRAEQAASAESAARSKIATGRTLSAIGEKMAAGDLKHLHKVRSAQDVDTLDSVLKRARWDRFQKAQKSEPDKRHRWEEFAAEPHSEDDVSAVDYPYPKMWSGDLRSAAADLKDEPGLMRLAQKLAKASDTSPKFKTQGNGFKFNGGQVLSSDAVKSMVPGLTIPEDKALRLHTSYDWRLAQQGKGLGPFYTANGGKTFGTSPAAAVVNALTGEHQKHADLIEPAEDKLLTIDNPHEIDTLKTIASRLRNRSDSKLKRIGESLSDRLEHYNRLHRADIKSPAELRAALREYLPLKQSADREDPVKKMERGLIGKKIPGFFPTPRAAIDDMLDRADIQPGMSVLEPSAGKGDILDAIREREPEAKARGIEYNSELAGILKAKGHDIRHGSFLDENGEADRPDRIVMNPPFEDGQDAEHVRHAYDVLKPGGKLVAIMSNGPFFRESKKDTAFREWLDSVHGEHEEMPEGSFAGNDAFRQTGVRTRMVTIQKPGA